jgi:uncharacterized protein
VSTNPFVIPVKSLMHKPGTSETLTRDIPAPTHYGEAVCVVAQGEPLHLTVLLESVHEGILVSGTVDTTAQAECVRCLDHTTVAIQATIQELFAYLPDDSYDYEVVQDEIDLDQVVRDQVVVELPFQPVCSPDCPGLDPETGEKRDAESAAADTTRIDPRWSKLQDVFPENSPGGESG